MTAKIRETMLNEDPKFGFYPWWPEDGEDWIHPDDAETARQMIPSERVFERVADQAPYYRLCYGDQSFRVKPTLWIEVEPEEFRIGDWVELRTQGGLQEHHVGQITDVLCPGEAEPLEYRVRIAEKIHHKRFQGHELKPVNSVDHLGEDQEFVRPLPEGGLDDSTELAD